MRIPRPAPGRGKIWLLATACLLVATAIAIWWGLAATLAKPTWTTITWDVQGDHDIVVKYEVTKPTDMTVVCLFDAQALDHSAVGSKEVTLGPVPERTRRYETQLRTTTRAVTGTLRNCREIATG